MMSTWPVALVAVLSGTAYAAPIGPDNHDFATFEPAVLTQAIAHYGGWTQALADQDGDGRLDRLVRAVDAAGVRVWTSRSNGDGTFASPVLWQSAGNWAGWAFAMADIDGDGADDIVLRRNGPAGWQSAVARSLGGGAFDALVGWSRAGAFDGWTSLVADFTGDHRADLLLSRVDAAGWHIALAQSDGTGSFTDPIHTTFAGTFGNWLLNVGDFNGDGRTDLSLETSDPITWRAWIALAAGDRTFAAPTPWLSLGSYAGTSGARGDFDGDGRTDLLLWAADAGGWRAYIALASGAGFAPPLAWVAPPAGSGWSLSTVDVNGDGATDMVLQRADATGWQARVAVGSGGGSFFPPRPWGSLAKHFGGWSVAAGDFSGDGRADVMAFAVDAAGWRAHVALARGCDLVIGPSDDFDARLAAVAPSPVRQTICLDPGRYEREILIAGKHDLSFIAAHGDVTIAARSYAFPPAAAPGSDPGAPVQIWQSHDIELDGFEIHNLFPYQLVAGPDGELDQTQMVSRAVEILDSTAITVSNSHLIGAGKQVLHVDGADGTVIEASQVDCYYFCVDARHSTIALRRSGFRAAHENPDVHALFWTDHSSQTYVNCTMNMVTGKSLFAGVNDFATDLLEVTGSTDVTPSAQAWISQHPNYDGINLVIQGAYPPLLDWYFIDWMGGGWQQQSQICYDPGSPLARCVSHFE